MTNDPVTEAVNRCLQSLADGTPIKVGFSGGMDSHVLLHALCNASGRGRTGALSAIHVNHGLQAEARQWACHCERICRDLEVPLETAEVRVPADAKSGPEAAARQARYQAFEQRLRKGEALLLAQHLDDQAETFLLQLLRGAGPVGLSAMPAKAAFGPGCLLRPLLEVPRDDIRDYAERHSLDFVQDPSNRELRYDRNYLRHEILPRLAKRWPAASRTIARAAGHQAALARIARELGARALDEAEGGVTLSCKALSQLPRDTARLALRAWLEGRGFSLPSRVKLDRILDEVVTAAADAEPLVAWPGAEVRRYRGELHLMAPLPQAQPDKVVAWNGRDALNLLHGRLEVLETRGNGLDAARLRAGEVEVCFRKGGERCRPAGATQSSTLKAWFQRRGVPPWERDRVPLIFIQGELAAVAGHWVCQGFQCAEDEEGVVLKWTPAC